MAGPIDHIDLVAFLHQQRGPSGAAIGTAHPVRALAAAAVNQHDRVGMSYARRNLVLHIHLLAVDDCPARNLGLFHAHPEEAPLREIEWCVGSPRSCRFARQVGAGAQSAENRYCSGGHGGEIAPGKLILCDGMLYAPCVPYSNEHIRKPVPWKIGKDFEPSTVQTIPAWCWTQTTGGHRSLPARRCRRVSCAV